MSDVLAWTSITMMEPINCVILAVTSAKPALMSPSALPAMLPSSESLLHHCVLACQNTMIQEPTVKHVCHVITRVQPVPMVLSVPHAKLPQTTGQSTQPINSANVRTSFTMMVQMNSVWHVFTHVQHVKPVLIIVCLVMT